MKSELKTSPPLLVVVGETASGKSRLAMEIAKKLNGEIVCADSWTVYKGFDIGTAKPSVEEQKLIPHHLIDIVKATDGFNAALYQRLAKETIKDIHDRGKLPILVGGTGLYIDSVLYDYGFLPTVKPEERAERSGRELKELIKEAAERGIDLTGIDVQNKRRVIRALETNGQRPTNTTMRPNTLVIGIQTSREDLRQRIMKRVDTMLDAGLEGEVRTLQKTYGWHVEPMKGIGYREWREYLEGRAYAERHISTEKLRLGAHVPKSTLRSNAPFSTKLHHSAKVLEGSKDLDEVREKIISATMNLAKRQRTWFKRNISIQWTTDPLEAVDLATTFLNKKQ